MYEYKNKKKKKKHGITISTNCISYTDCSIRFTNSLLNEAQMCCKKYSLFFFLFLIITKLYCFFLFLFVFVFVFFTVKQFFSFVKQILGEFLKQVFVEHSFYIIYRLWVNKCQQKFQMKSYSSDLFVRFGFFFLILSIFLPLIYLIFNNCNVVKFSLNSFPFSLFFLKTES